MNDDKITVTETASQEQSEINELRTEVRKLKSKLSVILAFQIILTSVIVIYLLYKMTIGSIFGQIIGFVTGLFGG